MGGGKREARGALLCSILFLLGSVAVLLWGAQIYLAGQVSAHARALRELEEGYVRIEREMSTREKILSQEMPRLGLAELSRANLFSDLEAFCGRNGLRLLGIEPRGQKEEGAATLSLEIRFEGEYRSLDKVFSSLRSEGFCLRTESLELNAQETGRLLGVWNVAFLEGKK